MKATHDFIMHLCKMIDNRMPGSVEVYDTGFDKGSVVEIKIERLNGTFKTLRYTSNEHDSIISTLKYALNIVDFIGI